MTADLETSRQVAEQLEVAYSTLRGWANKFAVPAHKIGNADHYDGQGKAIFEYIKGQTDQDVDGELIKRRLSETFSEVYGRASESSEKAPSENPTSALSLESVKQVVADVVASTMMEQGGIAESYAKATYKIGQLEEKNRQLEEKLTEVRALLPDPDEQRKLAQAERLEQENARLREQSESQASKLERLQQQEREASEKLLREEAQRQAAEAQAAQLTQERDQLQTQTRKLEALQQAEREASEKLLRAEQAAAQLQAEQARLAADFDKEREKLLRELRESQAREAAKAAELEEKSRPRGLWERITGS